ncbi:amino acid permease [Sporolactobacillus sp. Y61]|uniref:Amino acid permease n=1 Tax=Sporolactobacillus sp. Y61 TaxID=3160863 RepID=A0AAU8II73_9BACL
MRKKKIGPILLSGLIIGPILGSGIIILPPLIFRTIGDYALVAWLLTMIVSFVFAAVFGRLYIRFPGDSGAAQAVEQALGKPFRNLGAMFLIIAVCLGPIAVLSTASDYLSLWTGKDSPFILLALLMLVYAAVSMSIASLGRLSLILSSSITLLLVSGALHSLLVARGRIDFSTPFQLPAFGYSLLLLFWCLVGWEVIGNYTGEVRQPKKTIHRAIIFSCLVIAVVSLTVAAAVQWVDPEKLHVPVSGKLDLILSSLFGSQAKPLIALITAALCLSTVIMVIGGVSRLIAAQADKGIFPAPLAYRNKKGVPVAALSVMFSVHLTVFLLAELRLITLVQIIAIANTFFLGNAFLGLVAAFRLLEEKWIRWSSVFLGIGLLSLLIFTAKWVLVAIVGMTVWTWLRTVHARHPASSIRKKEH